MRSLAWRFCVLFTIAATPAAAFAQIKHAKPQTEVLTRADSPSPLAAQSQSTAFTYQGRLTDSGGAANGQYDLEFKLYDGVTGGTQQGSTVTLEDVQVTNGVFTVQLDLGAAVFGGADRFLEVGVRAGASAGAFTTLSPRQQITSTPYAVHSLSAYAAPDQTYSGFDLPTDAGLALLDTSDRVVDAVGFTTSPAPYKEGAGLQAVTAGIEYSYFRKECDFIGGVGCVAGGIRGTRTTTPSTSSSRTRRGLCGGGINSTLSAGTVTLATPLANGASLPVNFLRGARGYPRAPLVPSFIHGSFS